MHIFQKLFYNCGYICKAPATELFTLDGVVLSCFFIKSIKPEAEFIFKNIGYLSLICRIDTKREQNIDTLNRVLKFLPNLAGIKTINLSFYANGGSLESNSFADFEKLNASKVEFTGDLVRLESYAFAKLDKMTQLHLSALKMKRIDRDAFLNLTKLLSLDLSCNKLKQIDKNLFSNLYNLFILNLNENNFKSFHADCFRSLTSLKLLQLHDCQIHKIRSGQFAYLVNLEYLDLSMNKIKRVKRDAFENMKSLKRLNLSYNRIGAVEPNAFQYMKSLINLDLSNNLLESVDTSLVNGLTSLERFNISDNKMLRFIANDTFDNVRNLKFLVATKLLIVIPAHISTSFSFEIILEDDF
jgi:hypothetical protein